MSSSTVSFLSAEAERRIVPVLSTISSVERWIWYDSPLFLLAFQFPIGSNHDFVGRCLGSVD
jgi:hypothetical protein